MQAGRAVGTKGSMLQSMTQRSGAVNVRVDKEPMVTTTGSCHLLMP